MIKEKSISQKSVQINRLKKIVQVTSYKYVAPAYKYITQHFKISDSDSNFLKYVALAPAPAPDPKISSCYRLRL